MKKEHPAEQLMLENNIRREKKVKKMELGM
jgi:hypothetical protein